MLTNVFVMAGAGLTLFSNFPVFLAGRFLYGVACGGFSVFCPKYISEVAPVEVKGPAGCLTQICITFGIIVPFTLGLVYEGKTDAD
jgi:MFS family permease